MQFLKDQYKAGRKKLLHYLNPNYNPTDLDKEAFTLLDRGEIDRFISHMYLYKISVDVLEWNSTSLLIKAQDVANATNQYKKLFTQDELMRKAIKAVRYLLGKGANIDYMDKNGVTALLAAVHWENNAVAEELLKAGADPNLAVSTHGFCTGPLLSATFKNNFEMIAILMAYGADLRNALELNSKGNGFKINEEQQKMLQTAWNVAQLTRIRHFESTKYMDTLLAVCSYSAFEEMCDYV